MTDERIGQLAGAIAEALVAGDVEQYRSLVESMTDAERAASQRPTVDALLKLTAELQARVAAALSAADTDYDEVQAVIDSMSQQERDLALSQAVLRAAYLEENAASLEQNVLEDLDLEIEMLELPGNGGPFLFPTDEELLRVVKACVHRVFTELPYTSESGPLRPLPGDPDASDADLEALLSDAAKLPESEPLNQGLEAVVLYTRWNPRLGRKTHASVIPAGASDRHTFGEARCETLCRRGWGHVPFVGLHVVLDEVDCPGCRNALVLGGFLKRE